MSATSRPQKHALPTWLLLVARPLLVLGGLSLLLLVPFGSFGVARDYVASAGWERVPVQLEYVDVAHSRGRERYWVEARYRYAYGGRAYRGHRVNTGADRVPNDHDAFVERLRHALERGEPVFARVNPAHPQEAYLLREPRWWLLLFVLMFGLSIVVVGSALLGIVRGPLVKGTLHVPTEPIEAQERYSHWFAGAAGLGLGSIAALWLDRAMDWRSLVFPVGVLAAGGAAALLSALSRSWHWHRYGPFRVTLDPLPGQVGGDVGGRIALRVPYREDDPYVITLQCVRSCPSERKGEREELVVWEERLVPHLQAPVFGDELRFRFEPPAHLPPGEGVAESYHFWRLSLTGPAKGPFAFERTYELPVQRGEGRSTVGLPTHDREQHAFVLRRRALHRATQQIRLTQVGDVVRIHSPLGLRFGMKLPALLAASLFAGIALFLTVLALREESLFMGVLALGFSVVGYRALVRSLFAVGRSLEVEVRNGVLRSTASWCGLRLWRREMVLTHAAQVSLESLPTFHDNDPRERYFRLVATDHGRKVPVADDIVSQESAEVLRDELIRLLAL